MARTVLGPDGTVIQETGTRQTLGANGVLIFSTSGGSSGILVRSPYSYAFLLG